MMMIKEFGGRVASVWDGLRPMTKKMLVGALQSSNSTPLNKAPNFSYDAHADWEVSRLLTALDEGIRRCADVDNGPMLFAAHAGPRTMSTTAEEHTVRWSSNPDHTYTVGGSRTAVSDFVTISASVPTMVFCSARVPHRISATGVVAARPQAVRWATMARRFLRPIRNTTVPPVDASRSHSSVGDGFVGSS